MAVTIGCPICRQTFPVPSEVLGEDGHQVIVRMDRSELYGHMRECEAKAKAPKALESRKLPDEVLRRRVYDMLDTREYLSKAGSRACTMCGTNGVDCMVVLDRNKPAPVAPGGEVGGSCCAACRDGNTHPAPGEAVGSCAQWAAERQAKA